MLQVPILVAILIVFTGSPAFAYLDPVSGYALFQALIAIIVAIYGFIILKPLKYLKKFFSKEKNKEKENKNHPDLNK